MFSSLWSNMGLGSSSTSSVEASSSTSSVSTGGTHFSVAFTSSLEGGDEPKPVPFDRVFSDPTSLFDTSTSQFTCVTPGSYYFSYNIKALRDKAAAVSLVKNGERQVMLYAPKSKRDPGMASQSIILDLAVDDTVSIQLESGAEYGIDSHRGMPMVTFTGILVKSP